jgi:hypothetical protein
MYVIFAVLPAFQNTNITIFARNDSLTTFTSQGNYTVFVAIGAKKGYQYQ